MPKKKEKAELEKCKGKEESFEEMLDAYLMRFFVRDKNEKREKAELVPAQKRHNASVHGSGKHYRVDLHGLREKIATKKVENAILHCVLSGQKDILIIHGKGVGVLRKMVYVFLKSDRRVISYRTAPAKLGGEGAVVAKLSVAKSKIA